MGKKVFEVVLRILLVAVTIVLNASEIIYRVVVICELLCLFRRQKRRALHLACKLQRK